MSSIKTSCSCPKPVNEPVLRFCRFVVVIGLLIWQTGIAKAADPETFSIDIQSSERASEGLLTTFAVSIPDRPVRDEASLYSPRVRAPDVKNSAGVIPGVRYYTAKGYTPLELIWDFGDGSPLVTIHERTSASHIYKDNGDFLVTVTALDQRGQFAKQTRKVSVMNRDPDGVVITATVLDSESHLIELAATAVDAAGDAISFNWDFGDGQSLVGSETDFQTVQHRYARPGTYEVALTVTDDDYPWSAENDAEWNDGQMTETYSVIVSGEGVATTPGHESADPASAEISLHGSLAAQTDGALRTGFDGKIKSFAGLYLSQVKSGACRFMFTAWDDAHLAHSMAVVDLYNVPPEGGRYRIDKPQFALKFEDSVEDYLRVSGSRLGAFGGASIPGISLANRALQQLEDPDGDGSVDIEALKNSSDEAEVTIPGESDSAMPGSPVVTKRAGFATRSGELVLDFVPGKYAVGYFDVNMTSSDKPYKDQPLKVRAEIALDLNAAAGDGIVRYTGCEGLPFKINRTWPADGTSHMPVPRPRISVNFNDRVDPAFVTEENIQLLYNKADGALVQVPSRLLRDERHILLVPDKALLPGVEYLMRVKVGAEGLRSRAGKPLPDDEESGWHEWRFDTALDLVPDSDEKQLLACHLFQPARDVPLILGKPALARIYANWEAVAGVDAASQTTDVNAVVKLIDDNRQELGSADMTFVRPDRVKSRNVDLRRAAHTAQIPFTPSVDMEPPLYVDVLIAPEEGREPRRRYRARCPLKLWGREPSISIDFFALQFDEWAEYPDRLQALMPTMQSIADDAVEYAIQQMPFKTIVGNPVEVLKPVVEIPPLVPQASNPSVQCASSCILSGLSKQEEERLFFEFNWGGIEDWLTEQSNADMVVVFGPHDRLQGGANSLKLRDGRAVIMVLAGNSGEHYPRYVNGTVHEMGHALSLEHIPYVVNVADRAKVVALREPCPLIDKDCQPFKYEAVEAMRISSDGKTWWNKSSVEGNEQSNQIFPLMFPGSIPEDKAFIANHQYRAIQRYLEDLGRR